MRARSTAALRMKQAHGRMAPRLLCSCAIAFTSVTGCGGAIRAQCPFDLAWTQWISTPVDDFGNGVAVDGEGHVYFCGTTDAGLAGPNQGSGDVFLAKYDSKGGLVWIRQFGTSTNDWVAGVKVDHAGNVLVAGHNGQHPMTSPFVAKLDSEGNFMWMEQFATTIGARCWSLALDSMGNALICGDTAGDLGGPSAGSLDGFVTKIDPDGGVLWNAQIGSDEWDNALGVAADQQNNVYITGFTFGSVAGRNAGDRDIYIAKFDVTGELVWARQIGTDDVDMPESLAVDATDSPVIGGQTSGALGGPNQGYADAFLAKFDEAGNVDWISQAGTAGVDRFYSVTADASGGIFAAGATSGSIGAPYAGMFDTLLVRFDSQGSFDWARQVGTPVWETASDVAIDRSGAVYVSASVFDGSLTGPSDAFLMKFLPDQPCADVTGDGTVGADDLVAVILAWGPCPAPPFHCQADLNCSGAVEVDDMISVILDWGPCG